MRRCRSPLDSLVATTRATLAVEQSLADRAAGDACEPLASAGTCAGCGGCRPARWPCARRRPGAPAALGATAGAAGRRRARRRRAVLHRDRALRRRPLPRRGPRAACRPAAAGAVVDAADRLLAGDWELLGVAAARHRRPRLVPRPGHRPAGAARPAGVPDRPPRRGRSPATSRRSGSCPGTTTSRCWPAAYWLTGDDAYAERGRRPAAVLVGGQPVPVRGALDQRHRARRPADRAGPGSAGCSTAGRGSADLFEDNDDALAADLVAPAATSRRSAAAGRRPTTTSIAEAAGRLVAACAFPWFAESDALARRRAPASCERELAANTFPSGINRELATDYHRFVAELGLVAAVEADARGHPLGDGDLGAAARIARRGRRPRRRHRPTPRARATVTRAGPGRSTTRDADPWASLLDLGAAVFGPCRGGRAVAPAACAAVARRRCSCSRRRGRATGPSEAPRDFADAGLDAAAHPGRRRPRDLVPLRRRPARLPVHRRPRARRRALRRGAATTGSTSWPTRARTATTASPRGGATSAPPWRTTPSRSTA